MNISRPPSTSSTRTQFSSSSQVGQLTDFLAQSRSLPHWTWTFLAQCGLVRQVSFATQLPQTACLHSASVSHGWSVVWEQCRRSNCVVLTSFTVPSLSVDAQ